MDPSPHTSLQVGNMASRGTLKLGRLQSAWSLALGASVGASLLHRISSTMLVVIVVLQFCAEENCCRPGKPLATGGQVKQHGRGWEPLDQAVEV